MTGSSAHPTCPNHGVVLGQVLRIGISTGGGMPVQAERLELAVALAQVGEIERRQGARGINGATGQYFRQHAQVVPRIVPARQLPQPHLASSVKTEFVAGGNNPTRVGTKGSADDGSLLSEQRRYGIAGTGIPNPQLSVVRARRNVAGASDNQSAIRAKADALHALAMPHRRRQRLSAVGLPAARVSRRSDHESRGCDQPPAVGTECGIG